ncbi:MAG TPA: hypothetical protein VKK61_04015 [Tepidisphaeraceae bacterium]|nr:hypothetical protein [Tepidisphaeraceae bacterium]
MREEISSSTATQIAPVSKDLKDLKDLSAEIILSVERLPGDRVTCRHIYGDHYRCNWWEQQSTNGYDNPAMHGLLVTTHRVRRSRFMKVTKSPGGLQFESSPTSAR